MDAVIFHAGFIQLDLCICVQCLLHGGCKVRKLGEVYEVLKPLWYPDLIPHFPVVIELISIMAADCAFSNMDGFKKHQAAMKR